MTDHPSVRPGVPAVAFLLYRKRSTAIATTFVHALNEAVRDLDESFAFAGAVGEGGFVLQGASYHILLEDVAEPAAADVFESALAHPFIDTIFPAARPIVNGHGAHVRISVGGGRAPNHASPTAPATSIDDLDLVDFEPEQVLPRLRLLRAATNAYAKQRFPLAVHWCQCDNLLAGPEFVQMAERGAETELFVKAVPYCDEAEGGALYGAVTSGAANVIGREVELAGAAVPPAWAADRLLQFVEKARTGVPAAGEALRFPSDEIVLVHDEPASLVFPVGHLKLTVEKLPNAVPHAVAPVDDAGPIGFLSEMDARSAGRAFGRR